MAIYLKIIKTKNKMKRANRIDREKDYLNICKRLVLRSYRLPKGLYWKFNGDILTVRKRAN